MPLAAAAAPPASTPLIGTFPIEAHIVPFEPESTICGFPITATYTGQGTFQVFFDEAGEPDRLHVHVKTRGTLSANGVTLSARASGNQMIDFDAQTVVEVGLAFSYYAPGTGVVLMDRGRLVWSADPETGDVLWPPAFEAGPHPQLHGDLGGLCEALAP